MSKRKRTNHSILYMIPSVNSLTFDLENLSSVGITLDRLYFSKLSKTAKAWGMTESFFISALLSSVMNINQKGGYEFLPDNDLYVDIPFTEKLKNAYSAYDEATRVWHYYHDYNKSLGKSEKSCSYKVVEQEDGYYNPILVEQKRTRAKFDEYLLTRQSFLGFSELTRTQDELIERFFNALYVGMCYRQKLYNQHTSEDVPSQMPMDKFSNYEQDFLNNKSTSLKFVRIYITESSIPLLNKMGKKFENCKQIMRTEKRELLTKMVFIALSYELDSLKVDIIDTFYIKDFKTSAPPTFDVKKIFLDLSDNSEIEEDNTPQPQKEIPLFTSLFEDKSKISNEKNVSSISSIKCKSQNTDSNKEKASDAKPEEIERGFEDLPQLKEKPKLRYEIDGMICRVKNNYFEGLTFFNTRYYKSNYYTKFTDIVLFIKKDFYKQIEKSRNCYNDKNKSNKTILQYVSLLLKNVSIQEKIFYNVKSEDLLDSPQEFSYTIPIIDSELEKSKCLCIQQRFAADALAEMINYYGEEKFIDIALENLYNLVLPDENPNQETCHSALAIPLVKDLFSKYIILEPEEENTLEENIVRFALYLLFVKYKKSKIK